MKKHVLSFIPMLAAAIALSGCSMFGHKDYTVACPDTGIIKEASFLPIIHSGGTGKHKTITRTAEARIIKFVSHCQEKKEGTVDIALDVAFSGHNDTKAANAESIDLPYFIAVLSPAQQVLQRQEFTTKIDFDNQPSDTSQPAEIGVSGVSIEQHTISLPLAAGKSAADYSVAIGFALTPAQLAYNRKHNDR